MNRDELLELALGRPTSELPNPSKWFDLTEQDEENEQVTHCRSVVGLGYRSVIVRHSRPTAVGASTAATTMRIAAVMNVATDPDHRGKGYATDLLRSAHADAASPLLAFAGLFCPAELASFFERLGYQHPAGTPDGFMACSLADRSETWPEGTVDTRGRW